MSWIIILIVAIALYFDFLNGRNDAANSIATIVSTRVLSPRLAVLWAAFFNFAAVFLFGVHVATTIGKGIVSPEVVTTEIIFSALIGAIIWTSICIHWGLPISVTHALIGGLIGSSIVSKGASILIIKGIVKVVSFIFLAPIIGLILASVITIIVHWSVRYWPPRKVDSSFRKLQLLSAAVYSLAHGTNDAQKTMGIIALLLYSNGLMGSVFHIPVWVIISCYASIALGTLLGGWKTVETMGMRLTKIQPVSGFCAETSGGITIIIMSLFGIPVSTTHTITGAIAGAGSMKRVSAVRWGIAAKILWAWVLTIPAAGLMGALVFFLVDFIKRMR